MALPHRSLYPLLALHGGRGAQVPNLQPYHMDTPLSHAYRGPARKIANTDLQQQQIIQMEETPENFKWIRFLLMESTVSETDITKLSPFVIHRNLLEITGKELANVTKQRNGMLLLEAADQDQSEKLLKSTRLGDISITVCPHNSMNQVKGVIKCRDLWGIEDTEIAQEMANQDVTEARRITVQRHGSTVRTNLVILTFKLLKLPSTVKIGYARVKVEPYIPNPLRCFKCQKFGHHGSKCRQETPTCPICSEKGHDGKDCSNTPKCANCNGPHTSFDKECSRWKTEKFIIEYKVVNNVTFKEARETIAPRQPRSRSYAGVVAGPRPTTVPTTQAPATLPTPPPPNIFAFRARPIQNTTAAQEPRPTNQQQQRKEQNNKGGKFSAAGGHRQPQASGNTTGGTSRSSGIPQKRPNEHSGSGRQPPDPADKNPEKNRKPHNPDPKGKDPVSLYNRFGTLTDDPGPMDMEDLNSSSTR